MSRHPANEIAYDTVSADLLKVDYADQHSFQTQRLRDKFRVQVPFILAATLITQWAVAVFIFGLRGFPDILTVSLLAAAAANVIGLINYRRLRLFPGSRRLSYLVPAFTLAWAIVVVVLLWLRPPYSIVLIAVGAIAGGGLSWIASAMTRRANSAPLHVLPSMRTNALLAELPGLNHKICHEPDDLATTGAPIVADLHGNYSAGWERALANAAMNGSTIYHIKQISESLTGRVRVDHLSENSFGTLRPSTLYFTVKRLGDFFGASLLLLVTSPVILLSMLAIKLDSPGPALFKQERIGFRMKPFTVYKLRTMKPTEPGIDAKTAAITTIGDPRITRIGKFMRDTRIDELPQLWNVLIGDLSLIGPRPEAAALSEWYDQKIEFYSYRHVVKPGITGWAQVNQGHVSSDNDVTRKLQYDFYYIKNFSLWLDVLIALKTLRVMLMKMGAK